MDDKSIDKIAILAKLCAIQEIQVKLLEDKKELEVELEQLEKDERKSNHN
jgi:hypothetical protein|tara:strand:- start:935 stop:1084 length:150 start_codon:yes stop_codon:yes gene_type:complete